MLYVYLTIIPRARISSAESIAIDSEAMGARRGNCFSKIQLVGQKYYDKTAIASSS